MTAIDPVKRSDRILLLLLSALVLFAVVAVGGYVISLLVNIGESVDGGVVRRQARVNDPHAPDRFVTTSIPLYDKNGGHALDPSGMFYVVTDQYLGKQYVVFTVSTSGTTTLSSTDYIQGELGPNRLGVTDIKK